MDPNSPASSERPSSMCPAHQARFASSEDPFPSLEGRHPCFRSGGGYAQHGRIHLPVSPACNIQCRFCRRDFNQRETRPGVARGILTPEQAVDVVARALQLCPAITVAGIAGPGDTLATDHAIQTFELIRARFPDLINCLSTNGLLLPQKAERLVAAGVKTLTVTVNAVDPAIQALICSHIIYEGKRLEGEIAARQLISNQLEGIRRVSKLGVVVKVNMVLIPGINEDHVGEVARQTAAAGASRINIIPLIPEHELSHLPPPNFIQIADARAAAAKHLSVFLHCQRCRADACGIPGVGPDFSSQLYDGSIPSLNETTFSHG